MGAGDRLSGGTEPMERAAVQGDAGRRHLHAANAIRPGVHELEAERAVGRRPGRAGRKLSAGPPELVRRAGDYAFRGHEQSLMAACWMPKSNVWAIAIQGST